MPIYQEAELVVDLKTSRILRFISLLQQNVNINTLINGKFLNLIVYLNKNKRISYFSKFHHFVNKNRCIREIKEKRVSKKLKINSFC